MKLKFKKYKIKKGDSLKSLSNQLGKPVQELRNFHNVYCKDTELISMELPIHLQHLYIYPSFDIEAIEGFPKVTFESNSIFKFNPEQVNDTFGVMHTITEGEVVTTVKFELSIKYLKKEGSYAVFEINRISDLFINDEVANTIADELAVKVSSVLYPLQLLVNEDGTWEEIYNYNTIVKRWAKQKEKILKEYEGDWAESYLARNESVLSDKALLNWSLKKDWSLSTYFSAIFINYFDAFEVTKQVSFLLFTDDNPLDFKVIQKITKYLDEDEIVRINVDGNLNEERSELDIINGYGFPFSAEQEAIESDKGVYRALYFLNKENKLETAFISCMIELEQIKKVEVVVSKI
jgi:hypothetical protein